MADTYNGIGTSYLGKCKFEQDDSFITTKWFLIGFPLFPMGSVRLRDLGSEGVPFFKRTTHYEFIEDVPLDILQVLRTYAYSIFIVAWFGYWAFGNKPPLMRFIMITLGILLPFGLRFFAKRFFQR
jgi:hypothetical protein